METAVWDDQSLLVDLDLEYVNFDDPSLPLHEASRALKLQRPVVHSLQTALNEYGITPLHLLSGRGHHLIWKVPLTSFAFKALSHLGHLPDCVRGKYQQELPPGGHSVPEESGRAFAGVGLVMEFLAHRALREATEACQIPIQLTAVEVGPIEHGREIISIDLSEYGDPLHTRAIRMPFSRYLKFEHAQASNASPLGASRFVIPLFEMDEEQGLQCMQDAAAVRDLATRASTAIPDAQRGMEQLIADYCGSKLARFHRYFYNCEHDAPDQWPQTYDVTPLGCLPKCVRRLLEEPNELLLKPAGLQHLVRTLTAEGWHPRHIAGLVRSKYERDYHLNPGWFVYDASLRADFYVRLFAGLMADGLDPLVDYNCKSTEEKGYCCWKGCGDILEDHRTRLVERCNHREGVFSTANLKHASTT
ncbi:hypothetical protein [Lacipirellula parvula]|uniref:Uncharacterized protein n=1 Tax=Lacipirellula parvula TaxID=2650471 RepID=A0A5K7XE78_9BACT|nr:hypothetical protein [Lacipirellula parvula]BBO34322.1 hypothetical protein PLANPX_3934 [Lacipirellula parvula]